MRDKRMPAWCTMPIFARKMYGDFGSGSGERFPPCTPNRDADSLIFARRGGTRRRWRKNSSSVQAGDLPGLFTNLERPGVTHPPPGGSPHGRSFETHFRKDRKVFLDRIYGMDEIGLNHYEDHVGLKKSSARGGLWTRAGICSNNRFNCPSRLTRITHHGVHGGHGVDKGESQCKTGRIPGFPEVNSENTSIRNRFLCVLRVLRGYPTFMNKPG